MKTIKFSTKLGRELAQSYLGTQYTDIYQVYGRYSFRKQLAQDYCRNLMLQEDGSDFRIVSWNRFHFTCGWRTADGIRIETRCNSYLITQLPF